MLQNSLLKKFFSKKGLLILVISILVAGGGAGIIMLKVSDSPSFCSTCHIMKPYYNSWHDDESNLLANKHAAKDVECHDCHKSSISTQLNEGIKYITGNYKNPLEKRQFPKEFCLECHSENKGATTYKEAKQNTDFEESNPHDSHNAELECGVCHSMHQPSTVYCSQCHMFDWADDLDEGWIKN